MQSPSLIHLNCRKPLPLFHPFSLTLSSKPLPASGYCLILLLSKSIWPARPLQLDAKRAPAGLSPVVRYAAASSPSTGERWLLEPVGDGDTRHLGFRVPLPAAFELASNVVTVGRLPEKADIVIPVATVSGLHARIEMNEGNLLVTDLDSTNGTYIDDRRLRPGASAILTPGSRITFGDMHLAMFRVSKTNVDPSEIEEDGTQETIDIENENALEAAGNTEILG